VDIDVKQSYFYWELLEIRDMLHHLKSKDIFPDGMERLAIEDCKKRLRLSESIEQLSDGTYLKQLESRYGCNMDTSPLPVFQAMAKAKVTANINPQYQSFAEVIAKSHQDITSSNALQGWLRSRNTLEVLILWEQEYNPGFKIDCAQRLIEESITSNSMLTIKRWIAETDAKGIVALQGRYGGTYAHPIIVYDFKVWLSPEQRYSVCSGWFSDKKRLMW
jgi:hypothetical protein